MILVLTTEAGDNSHSKFIDWLDYYNADYSVLTGESIYNNKVDIKIDSQKDLLVDGRNYSKDVSIVLNRRWLTTDELPIISDDKKFNIGLRKSASSELYEFRMFLDYSLKRAEWIPKIKNTKVNKLTILFKAMKSGLNVPDFLVTNKKQELLSFQRKHQSIITKAIGNFPRNFTDNNFIVNPIYTKVIDNSLLKRLPDNFQLSMFQNQIVKKKEFRVLYFNEVCYPVELLTQESEISKVDSRKTDTNEDKFRIGKAILPSDITLRITKLMKSINLNIGCIDLLLSENGKYYFLEVNPVGQISGYSYRGNLDFEKKIVEYMISVDQK